MTKIKSYLPKNWRWLKLGDQFEISKGKKLNNIGSTHEKGSTRYIQIDDLRDNTNLKYTEDTNGVKATEEDLIIVWDGANAGEVGYGLNGFIGSTLAVLRPKTNDIHTEYVARFLQTKFNYIHSNCSGATIPHVQKDILSNILIPLAPTLEEQKRIAARLDEQMRHIEGARLAAEESLSAAWELEKTYLLELFSKTSNKFQTTNISSVAKIQTGYAFKSEWFSSDGIRLLRNANVFQGYIDWGDCVRIPESRRNEFESFEMHEGDIVLSLDRPLVNNGLKVARLIANDIPSLLLQRVARFQVSESILPDYLYLFLRSPYFIDEITQHDQSIGVPHVSPKQVEAINLPLPDLKIQEKLSKEYQEKLLHTEQLIKSLESQLAEIESLPSAVLGQAFAGEL